MILVDTDGDVTQAGPLAARRRHRTACCRWNGRRSVDGMHVAQAIPHAADGRPLRQDGHEPRRGGDPRGIRAAAAPDRRRRIHPQRRSSNSPRRLDRRIPYLPPPLGRVHLNAHSPQKTGLSPSLRSALTEEPLSWQKRSAYSPAR